MAILPVFQQRDGSLTRKIPMNDGSRRGYARIGKGRRYAKKCASDIIKKTREEIIGPILSFARKGNIAMFHIGRSGSTVIGDLLDHHPKMFWDSEIFEEMLANREEKKSAHGMGYEYADAISHLQRRMKRAGERFYGFEVKFFHLSELDIELSEFVKGMHTHKFRYYIVLERRNYLKKIVSSVIAHQRSKFHQSSEEGPILTRIVLDVHRIQIDRDTRPLLMYLLNYKEQFDSLRMLLQKEDPLYLSYEDDIMKDPLRGYRRICNYINIDPHKVPIRYGRTNPFKLSEIIENYGKVEQYLRDTEFEWMLYE